MRVHTMTLTERDVREAACRAGVLVHRLDRKGSRCRAHAFDVILSGRGRIGTRYGSGAERYTAATWDEWGMALAELFRRDPEMTVPRVYEDGEHFRWVTAGRFDQLTPADQHVRHRWDSPTPILTGRFTTRECQCGAYQRWMVRGTWAEISDTEGARR